MENLCTNAAPALKIVGIILLVIKIAIPIILLITGVIAYGSAVISSDEKEMKNANKKLINKLIAAVVIFLLPTIIKTVFGLIEDYSELAQNYSACITCVTDPGKCSTTSTGSTSKTN